MSRYGLIGEKLEHSYSKELHEAFGLRNYELMEIPSDEIDDYFTKAEFDGINVTIPYKQTAFRHCIADKVALEIGAVNTMVNRDGRVYGYNTDYLGFEYMLKRAGISLTDKKVAILGNGGTSRTARFVCKRAGAASVVVLSRKKITAADNEEASDTDMSEEENKEKHPDKRDCCDNGIISDNGGHCDNGKIPDSGSRVLFATYDQKEMYSDAEVIINTTPVGMYPNVNACPIDISVFDRLEAVVDVIYNPAETELLKAAGERGIKCTCGLPMLVAQGWYAERLFFGEALNENDDVSRIPEIENVIERFAGV